MYYMGAHICTNTTFAIGKIWLVKSRNMPNEIQLSHGEQTRQESNSATMADYDEVLKELGEFGPWQLRVTLLCWLPIMMQGAFTMMASWTALHITAYR